MMCLGQKMITVLSVVLMLCLVGCGEDGAACFEDCNENKDCGSGLICGSSTCVPDECKQCFNSGETCYYDKTFNENTEVYDCDFDACQ